MLKSSEDTIEYFPPKYIKENEKTRFDFYSYIQEYSNGIKFKIVLNSNRVSENMAMLYFENLKADIKNFE